MSGKIKISYNPPPEVFHSQTCFLPSPWALKLCTNFFIQKLNVVRKKTNSFFLKKWWCLLGVRKIWERKSTKVIIKIYILITYKSKHTIQPSASCWMYFFFCFLFFSFVDFHSTHTLQSHLFFHCCCFFLFDVLTLSFF